MPQDALPTQAIARVGAADCLTLSCPPYVLWEDFWVRFSRRGVNVAEKISEVDFLYGDPARHAQPHTNLLPANLHLTEHENIDIFQPYAW